MRPRTSLCFRVIYALALNFGCFTIASGALAQSSESTDDASSFSSPIKKKKTGTVKKKKKGKKKIPAVDHGDPEASIEFDTDISKKSAESSGSAWIFLISMITFMAGIIFWYTKHQAAESAKHLSDLDFADENKPGLPTNDSRKNTRQGIDLNNPDPEATVIVYPNGAQNPKHPVSPDTATVIIAPLATTKIIAQETLEARPINKN